MVFFWFSGFNFQFTLEMLVCSIIYVLPLQKRNHFWPRVIVGVLLCFLISAIIPLPNSELLSALELLQSSAKFVLEFVAVSLFVMFCCNVSLHGAFFSGGCIYATQHILYCVCAIIQDMRGTADYAIVYTILAYAVILPLFYHFFARQLSDAQYDIDARQALLSTLLLLLIVFVLSTATQQYFRIEPEVNQTLYHLYAILCCTFLLWVQVGLRKQTRLQGELAMQEQLRRRQQEQYQLSRENIEIINRKCHDLKYQIAALRMMPSDEKRSACLDEMEKAVEIYDTSQHTGNEVLDTVLTEKALFCEAHEINMTCVADGSKLGFMEAADIYTIFGNALDNAIESVGRLTETERRLIGISVWSRSSLLMIQIENYYEQQLCFQDGLPVTTKVQSVDHGIGLKSIRYTVEKYGGVLSIHPENHVFILRITIPLPEQL